MDIIRLPILPNEPLVQGNIMPEGEFCLKKFGSFGFVQNILFDEGIISYKDNYQSEQSKSSIFQDHTKEIYHLIKSHFPKGGKLVEVGCGKGAFLDLVRTDGHFSYEGYDTAYEGSDPNIFSRYLTEADNIYADVIVLRHTMEHIVKPHIFLQLLSDIFGSNTLIWIDGPCFDWIEDNKVLFDLSYEQVSYYTSDALCSLFSEVVMKGVFFEGQYQYCLASLESLDLKEWCDFEDKKKWSDFNFNGYVEEFQRNIQVVSNFNRIWVWGGSKKGVMFLKHLADFFPQVFSKVKGVVDINERKQSKFTASTNIEIISPLQMSMDCLEDDLVLVMNPNYLEEVKKELANKVSYNLFFRTI